MLFILFCLTTGIQAQETIAGRVLEKESGETLPFATIRISGTTKGTNTNQDGFFSLFNIDPISTTLEVTYVGFETKLIRLDSVQNLQAITIYLTPLNEELSEFVITANSNKVLDATSGISTTTISTKQLALLPNVGETDIFRSLQLLPGVSGTNESSSGLFVRGGTPDQNLVMLDGITVYKVDHFFGFFSAFNANAVKDVQLFKGAFPAKYGGRTSSVVEMTGKSGSFQEAGGGINLNLLSVNGYLELPISPKLSFLAAGRRSYTDVIRSGLFESITNNLIGENEFENSNLDPADINTVEPDFYFYDWNAKLSYKPSESDMITFSLYSGRDFLDESSQVNRIVASNEERDLNLFVNLDEITNWGNRGASMKWSKQWNPKWYSNVMVAGSEYFSEYNRDGQLSVTDSRDGSEATGGSAQSFEDNKVTDLTFRADFEYQQKENVKTEFGISLTYTDIDYTNIRNDTLTILERQQQANYGSVYWSSERTIGDKLTLSTGIRYSYYDLEDRPLWEPRVSMEYRFTDQIKLKGAFGQHYQFVNRIINENITEGSRDFWLLADGEQVNVSKAVHYVIGASYETGDWLFDVEAYYKNLSNLSEFSLRFRRSSEINAEELFFTGDGIARGIEFLIQKKHGDYTGWASYTLGSVRHTFPGLNEGLEFAALHDQLHEFKMVHSYELGDWNFSSTFIYGSGKPFSEPAGQYTIELLDGREFSYIGVGPKNGSRLPAYARLDLSAHYGFDVGNGKGDLGISFFNFLNRQNIWYKEYDFSQNPVLISNITYLGFTPNLSFSINF